jgi:hypothetical protein
MTSPAFHSSSQTMRSISTSVTSSPARLFAGGVAALMTKTTKTA